MKLRIMVTVECSNSNRSKHFRVTKSVSSPMTGAVTVEQVREYARAYFKSLGWECEADEPAYCPDCARQREVDGKLSVRILKPGEVPKKDG